MDAMGGGREGAQRRHEGQKFGDLGLERNAYLPYLGVEESLVTCPVDGGAQPAKVWTSSKKFSKCKRR